MTRRYSDFGAGARVLLHGRERVVPASAVRARVNVCVELFDVKTAALIRRIWQHNRAVDVGLNMIRDLLYGDAIVGPTHCAIGTSATAPAAGDAALGNEVFRGALAQRTKVSKGLVLRFALSSQQANGNTLAEAGLFNAAVGGLMYARVTPESFDKSTAVSALYTWTLSWEAEV